MQNNDSQRSFDTATCPRNAAMMPTPLSYILEDRGAGRRGIVYYR